MEENHSGGLIQDNAASLINTIRATKSHLRKDYRKLHPDVSIATFIITGVQYL